jgi:hypothetical protein
MYSRLPRDFHQFGSTTLTVKLFCHNGADTEIESCQHETTALICLAPARWQNTRSCPMEKAPEFSVVDPEHLTPDPGWVKKFTSHAGLTSLIILQRPYVKILIPVLIRIGFLLNPGSGSKYTKCYLYLNSKHQHM